MRRFHFALLALVLVLAAQPLAAATFYVGSCKAGSFGTISAAVAAVPAGSIVNVCPGTYPEQVVISQALTLKGMLSGNSSQAVIAMPSGGLVTTPEIHFGAVAAQVEVTAGPVNISNITVDGTAGTNCPSTFNVGIFYSSGSAGTVNEVETRNQNCSGEGSGIFAENGAGATQTVKIQNSNIHDADYAGIFTCSDQTPSTLTATITGNYVASGTVGIFPYCNAAGSISGNTVTSTYGIYVGSPFTTVSGNTVTGRTYGLFVNAAASITSNRISNSTYGIWLAGDNASLKTNTITKTNVGIEFLCHPGTVTGNTINGADTGFDAVPAAFTGVNKFYNVATVRTGC